MPRATITPHSLAVNATPSADPTGTAIVAGASNGGQIANAEPEQTILRVSNASGGSATVTLLAGSQPSAIASGQGNLAHAVADGATAWFGPVESARFQQPDGSLIIESTAAVAVTAFRVHRH